MNWTEKELSSLLDSRADIIADGHQSKPTELNKKLAKLKGQRSGIVEDLVDQIVSAGLPAPTKELKFHPSRMWRFDLCWIDLRLACEIEGGSWMQTKTGRPKGHAHPLRFENDCAKYSEAAILGWQLIRVTPAMIEDGRAIDLVNRGISSAINKMSWYSLVKKFHCAFSHDISDTPRPLREDEKVVRAGFIIEEIGELMQADGPVAQIDAIVDAIYFLVGTCVNMGIDPDPIFRIVHQANMEKLWSDGQPRWRADDGKVIKPEGWQPPEPAIEEEIVRQKGDA